MLLNSMSLCAVFVWLLCGVVSVVFVVFVLLLFAVLFMVIILKVLRLTEKPDR